MLHRRSAAPTPEGCRRARAQTASRQAAAAELAARSRSRTGCGRRPARDRRAMAEDSASRHPRALPRPPKGSRAMTRGARPAEARCAPPGIRDRRPPAPAPRRALARLSASARITSVERKASHRHVAAVMVARQVPDARASVAAQTATEKSVCNRMAAPTISRQSRTSDAGGKRAAMARDEPAQDLAPRAPADVRQRCRRRACRGDSPRQRLARSHQQIVQPSSISSIVGAGHRDGRDGHDHGFDRLPKTAIENSSQSARKQRKR